MIKVQNHTLTCRCDDCAQMFPHDRFEPTWTLPQPSAASRRAIGALPLGHPQAGQAFAVWLDSEDRLEVDWPGFPGTAGAKVEVDWRAHPPRILGTKDPALSALADPVPLRRKALERMNQRLMVDYGLASEDTADFVSCERHGHGIPALACEHVVSALNVDQLEVVVLYGVDGDYPDLLCEPCLERYLARDLSVVQTVCSRCQQEHLYRHRLVGSTWYGAS